MPKDRIGITLENPDGTSVYTYVGVDFGKDAGERELTLTGLDKFGEAKFEESINVVRVGRIASIRLHEMPGNVADGKTPIQLRVELLDRELRPIRSTAQLEVIEGSLIPYTTEEEMRQGTVNINRVEVSSDGVVRFRPTSRAGRYRIVLGFERARDELSFQITPESREWIMVGLGEGTAGYQDLSGNMEALDARQLDDSFYQDGRLAFFAKGTIKGEWLTTLSYDSDRQTGPLFRRINAAQYYTLYGDSSAQRSDSPTQDKLFVRVENDQLNATYGDFSTQLSRLELAEYNRRMTGLRVEYVGDRFGGTAFAAETTQAFIRDDIQGNGTSGIYRLSEGGIIQSSEIIMLQVRDRFQNQVILDERPMHRDFDYVIDYERGELKFKSPIFSQDFDGNPLFIVSRYEINTDGKERLNAGGRLVMAFNAGKGLVGATVVNEEVQGREGELRGVDVTYDFSENTELIAEYARTNQRVDGGEVSGDAYKISLQHQSAKLDTNVYVREQDAGFGLGQQAEVGAGTRVVGAAATVKVNEAVSIRAEGFDDKSLETGRSRQVLATGADFETDALNYGVGIRSARDSGGGLDAAESNQVTGRLQTNLLDRRLRLRTTAEVPLGPADNEAFPLRLLLGADYDVNDAVTLTGQQEFTWSDLQNTQRTTAGVRSRFWRGLDVNTSVIEESAGEGQRLLANYGLVQNLSAGNWSFDVGMDRAQTITASGSPVNDNVNPDAAPVFGNAGGDFTAMFAGANYSNGPWQYVSRIEQRLAEDEQLNLNLGAMRNLEDGVVLASILDVRIQETASERLVDNILNVGLAYRPDDSKWRILNRLDLAILEQTGGEFNTRTRKIVNNLNANYQHDPQTQVSLQYAFKYVLSTIDNIEYSGFTDLVGAEVRRNITSRWDVGAHANMLHSWNSDVMDAAYGLSVGYQVMPNSWVSVGYNFEGFRDSDFDDADYTAKGVYLKFRFKFDQDSAKALFGEKNVFD